MTDREKLPSEDVERVADAIEAVMGPVFGSPEYLADPVKMARAEKRRRDGALAYARAALSAMPDRQAGINEGLAETLHSTARGLEHAANMIRAGETPQASALDQCAKNCDDAGRAIRAMKVEK